MPDVTAVATQSEEGGRSVADQPSSREARSAAEARLETQIAWYDATAATTNGGSRG